MKASNDGDEEEKRAERFRWTPVVMATACVLLIAFTLPKGIAEYLVYKAERTENIRSAAELYRSSLWLDKDNASAYYYFAARLAAQANDPAAAAKYLREGIDRGIGVTMTYSKLAKYQQDSGDTQAAKTTLAEAAAIFPNSVFIRVRFAEFLRQTGDLAGEAGEMAAASEIDGRQANGWRQIMTLGSVAAFYNAKEDPSIAPPSELRPENAVLDYVDKNQIPAN